MGVCLDDCHVRNMADFRPFGGSCRRTNYIAAIPRYKSAAGWLQCIGTGHCESIDELATHSGNAYAKGSTVTENGDICKLRARRKNSKISETPPEPES